MIKKLSNKEREDNVTKGYLHDVLDDKLSAYVTKDFLINDFKNQLKIELEDSFTRHIQVLMEDNYSTTMTLIEAFQNRFKIIEKHIGLAKA